jgi:putative methyltransferase (TIGR04325 family)
MRFKDNLNEWLPPVILRALSSLRKKRVRFEGSYKTWEQAVELCTGYDDYLIRDKVLAATQKVKNGGAVFERDSVLFDEIQYSWPITAALMLGAARNNGNLHVLDFGGSLGSSYFQNRKFLCQLEEVSWHIVEQPHFVESGKKFIETDILKFYLSIEESVKTVMPNVILLSSVVQYLKSPQLLFDQLNSIKADLLLFDRTPFTNAPYNTICIQHVPADIYKASYPMWLLSRDQFLGQLSNWRVHENFSSAEGKVTSDAGLEFEFSGYVLQRIYV